MLLQRVCKEKSMALLDGIDTILLDCDGVIWKGKKVIPGAIEAIQSLRERGKRLFFITNNSTRSRESFVKSFQAHGIKVKKEEIVASAFLLAQYLQMNISKDKGVYVIGREGITDELTLLGIPTYGGAEDDHLDFNFSTPLEHHKTLIGAVVVGFDAKFNYTKLAKALTFLNLDPSCQFIATNTDNTFPDEHHILPGTGCIVAALACALQREPIVIGKPNTLSFELLKSLYPHIHPGRTLMIGDKIETDIVFGRRCGIFTMLVESGVDNHDKALLVHKDSQPHYIADSLAILR